MPSVDVHCKISKKRTGKEYRELHEWIDQPREFLGKNHRLERHSDNEFYREYIKEKWGERAVIEWLFHIAVDNLHTAYRASDGVYEFKIYNYYQFALTHEDDIYFDCKKLNDVKLLKKFNEED